MTLALNLPQDINPVIVAQSSAHLVVVHRKMIFLYTPKTCEAWRIDDFKNSRFPALPSYEVCISLGRVVKQLLQKVP